MGINVVGQIFFFTFFKSQKFGHKPLTTKSFLQGFHIMTTSTDPTVDFSKVLKLCKSIRKTLVATNLEN